MIHRNDWESSFFSKIIYSLDPSKWDQKEFEKFILKAKPHLVECKVNGQNYEKVNELINAGFNIVEINVDFSKDIHVNSDKIIENQVETAKKEDIDELSDIAGRSFSFSRYRDDIFGQNAQANIYREWVGNAVLGKFDDICLIKKNNERIEGFITCRSDNSKVCRIGLIGVKEGSREKGVGRILLDAAERYASSIGSNLMKVATQYKNRNALKLYASDGYKISDIYFRLYWLLTR